MARRLDDCRGDMTRCAPRAGELRPGPGRIDIGIDGYALAGRPQILHTFGAFQEVKLSGAFGGCQIDGGRERDLELSGGSAKNPASHALD